MVESAAIRTSKAYQESNVWKTRGTDRFASQVISPTLQSSPTTPFPKCTSSSNTASRAPSTARSCVCDPASVVAIVLLPPEFGSTRTERRSIPNRLRRAPRLAVQVLRPVVQALSRNGRRDALNESWKQDLVVWCCKSRQARRGRSLGNHRSAIHELERI